MLASPAIKGRVAAVRWRPFRRLVTIVYGFGESVTVRAKGSGRAEIGDTIYLVDSDAGTWFSGRRLYLDFASHGLQQPDSYGVWLSGKGLSHDQAHSKEFECLSAMVDDWFTFVEDDVALTLLCVTNGDGHFRIGRDHVALA